MSQLWKLVFLCGLLAGTSKSQAVSGLQQTYVQEGVGTLEQKSGLLEEVAPVAQNKLESLGQELQTELKTLQESSVWKGITKTIQEGKNFLGNVISDLGSLGAKLTGVQILDVKLEVNNDGKSMDLRFPIRANVTVALPVLGQLANLDISLDLLTTTTVKDLESDNPSLVQGKCRSDPASFKLNLFNGKSPTLNYLVNSVLSLKQKVVSFLVERAVCPLLHFIIESKAGIILKNILDQINLGVHVGI